MDTMVIVHLVIAVVGVILLIAWAKLNPVISLIIGSLYLGVAGGLGFTATVTAVNTGFGDLMTEVGLIIGFGVMIGTALSATGTMQRVVDSMLKVVGPSRSPYVLGLASGILFPSIYFDVALVILAPMAGTIAKRTGRSIAQLAGALAIGLEVGLLVVVPGVAAVAVAGPLGIPLGKLLIWGVPLGIVFIISSIFLHSLLMRRIFDPATDRDPEFDDSIFGESPEEEQQRLAAERSTAQSAAGTSTGGGASTTTDGSSTDGADVPNSGSGGVAVQQATTAHRYPLIVAMLPVIVPVVLIVADTFTRALGSELAVLGFVGSPVVALLIGLVIGIILAIPEVTRNGIDDLVTKGAANAGSILLFTGVAGSLGAVITQVGVGEMLANLFQANAAIPVLLAWVVAAVLRLAQGSASVAAITAATLLAPIMGSIEAAPLLILLAAGSGAAFGGHVTDNTFWIFKQMLGFSTKGTFKIYTLAQSTFAVVGLAVCLVLDLFL
ncbi:GntP family permease [Brachybacterium fresconis]|uniref:H+/gluconate symporter-like permease n=1 Tax=Brachybacterium fresconis TaxID=173363 RepID=A0ABS4YLA0_9MICO|nr:SLC13 family permease [Brachybacterium fresconis]MBP2409265.1 H+/gluconate symporter-like permease [Brachybacterium fresconis]